MTYYIDPYGCAKNQVDAEHMMADLNQQGWSAAETHDEADLIIVNSCGFIESAKQESINAVLYWRKLYPNKKILLAGCLAQRYGDVLAEALPEADSFRGIEDLPQGDGERPLLSPPGLAYVKISEGCSNHCSYCAIPLIRGDLRSRDMGNIIEECRTLIGRGMRELCLIGQDTASYGKDLGLSLAGLLEELSRLEGDFWIRLLYMHPDHFPFEILDLMERDLRILPYFDLPFQHASEKILASMNRKGNHAAYLDLLGTIRNRLDAAVIRTTLMTGFPGESEKDFEELRRFQEEAQIDWLGCFDYSPEEGTPAFTMKGRVSKKKARERRHTIEQRQREITEGRMERFIGQTCQVLVEEAFKALEDEGEETPAEGLYLGRMPCQAPEVDGLTVIQSDGPLEPGTLVRCQIIGRSGIDLRARVLV